MQRPSGSVLAAAPAAALAAAVWLAVAAGAAPARAELAAERIGGEVTLPQPPRPHQVWVADLLLRRTALVDADDGRFLGMLSAGVGAITPVFSQARGEIYLPETYYSRGTRGERTDVVTIYDTATLRPGTEIVVPPKRADIVRNTALATLLDDGRFLVLYDFTPATSVSVVDVVARRFVGEIQTPGCSLVYAAGPRRFAMVCGDGSLLLVRLDAEGREAGRARSARFFDPIHDPVTEKAVRVGDQWLFVSFGGIVHPVDLGGEAPQFGETWSLLDGDARAASWRIGGTQHLAVHAASGRLYELVHQGGPDGHKDPGTEVWVYDLATHERVQRIVLENLSAAFVAQRMGVESRIGRWVLDHAVPSAGTDSIAVTQDDHPLLLAVSMLAGTIGVYDARSGELLRNVADVGLAPGALQAPWR
jgi:methylamine dehydrogenase heavy chain